MDSAARSAGKRPDKAAPRRVAAIAGIALTVISLAAIGLLSVSRSEAAPAVTRVDAGMLWNVLPYMTVEAGDGQSNHFKTFLTSFSVSGEIQGYNAGVVDCANLYNGVCIGGGKQVEPQGPNCRHPDFDADGKVNADEPFFAVCGLEINGAVEPPQAFLVQAGDMDDVVEADFNGSLPFPHRIEGERGADRLTGTPFPDVIFGGDDADVIDGLQGGDQIFGGAVNGDDPSSGDIVDYSRRTSAVRVTLGDGLTNDGGAADNFADALTGIEGAWGGSGNDDLEGSPRNDNLRGGPGDDNIDGAAGADKIDGGRGVDTIQYPRGDDTTVVLRRSGGLRYSGSNCELENDKFQTSACEGDELRYIENVETGSGNDDVHGDRRTANVVHLGPGDDRYEDLRDKRGDTVYGGPNADVIRGGRAADEMFGEEGDDTLAGGDGPDTFNGGSGEDTADYSSARGPARVTVGDGQANDGVNGRDSDRRDRSHMDNVTGSIEIVRGGPHGDELTADQSAADPPKHQELYGDDGPDRLWGGPGPDLLEGGGGVDWIFSNNDGDVPVVDTVDCGSPNPPDTSFDEGEAPRFEDWADVDPIDAPSVNANCENIAEPEPDENPFAVGAGDL